MDLAWMAARWDKGGKDYINCPLDRPQYEDFVAALNAGEKMPFKDWEHVPYFDGCLPIEVMAERGRETLRHGPMKPVGLTKAHDPQTKAWAVVQLRQDNALGTLWNMVGFQTKLKHGAQTEIFRMIPGLERAVFARLGGLHRNTFLNSPKVLDSALRLKADPRMRFAGQVTGVEGYVESAAVGLIAGRLAAAERLGVPMETPPPTTALGALVGHITGGHLDVGKGSFQPMNINYGLLPPIEAPRHGADGKRLPHKDRGRAKKRLMGERALADLEQWIGGKVLEAAE
jgi:methylenetetrahydrofolate--tRNA-(uracil-5-)-methyltransferase